LNRSELPDDVAEALAQAGERVRRYQGRLLWYEDVSSTNDVAAVAAEHGAPEGTVIAADAQSAGRGRRGRVWASPAHAGLYVSVVLRPAACTLSLITLATGVAIADGIAAATGLQPHLKWPNDVYVSGRKLAGILAEGVGTSHVVVGFGINLLPAAYPPDVAARATSIESELGRPVNRGLVLAECLAALAARQDDLVEHREAALLAAWRARAADTFGRRVEWDEDGAVRAGTAEDVDATGGLLIRVGPDLIRRVAGEVRWT
jgi:BirA family transcriptional regulator, biotin operon repressor / biotin---[acetyl-CoA-carboxylase] ligase